MKRTNCHIKFFFGLFLVFFTVSGFSQTKVRITRQIEKSELPGKYLVTLRVYKPGIEGFAKIIERPADGKFKAEALPSDYPGLFKLNEDEIRVLFTALPAADSFDIKYNLFCDNMPVISGKFVFLQDNERREVNTNDVPFMYKTGTGSNRTNQEDPDESLSEFDSTMIRQEIVPASAYGEYFVTVNCSLYKNMSYVKIAYKINNGYILEGIQNGKSSVSISGNGIKFVWVTFPQNGEEQIKFRIKTDPPKEKPVLKGTLSLLEDNIKKNYSIHQFNK